MRKALLLDRDGIINEDLGYVHEIKNFIFNKDIFNLVKFFKAKSFKIIVITNQSGIGRGYFTIDDFFILNNWMLQEFQSHKANIDGVYFCPSHPLYGLGEYKKEDFNRKPNPGMILQAKLDFDLDLSSSILIGDRESDLFAALNAKVGKIFHFNKEQKLDRAFYKDNHITHLESLNPLNLPNIDF